ncbi:hypothetical protein MOSE0_J05644 [Monosporozyma servazzii]
MHSHHSHSGSYSQHGSSSLDSIIEQVEKLQMKLFCLTEHIPRRNAKYLYPEEKNGLSDLTNLIRLEEDFDKFVIHAQRIKQEKKDGPTTYIIGTEIESCDLDQLMFAKELIAKYDNVLKFCVGSVHHIKGIPIDFDQENWNLALKSCNNNLKEMLLSYFNNQLEMLRTIKPLVVGHFDVYKLFLPKSLKFDSKTGDVMLEEGIKSDDMVSLEDIPSLIFHWDEVNDVVIRNLKFINTYGGVLEINTSALRKRLAEPYPGKDICELAKQYCRGKFVLSDDSHAVAQVATCYPDALEYITDVLNLKKMYYLNEGNDGELQVLSMSIEEFANDSFWKQLSLQ